MGRVTRRVMEMKRDELEGQIRIVRRMYLKVFLLAAGYMVIFAVLMALAGRMVKTVVLLVAQPAKEAADPLVVAVALFGGAVLSVVVGMTLCLRGVFDPRFKETRRMNTADMADVERKLEDLLSAALPGLEGGPYQNRSGSGPRSRRLAWAGRLFFLAALLTAALIYMFSLY